MSVNFGIQSNVQHTTSSVHSSTTQQIGTFMGQKAMVVKNPMSLLADAAEELTFAVDTTDEFELEERKEKKHLEDIYLQRVKLYEEMMHRAGNSEQIDLFKNVLRANKNQDSDWIIQQALKHFNDPSDAWVALFSAIEDLQKETQSSGSTGAELAIYKKALHAMEGTYGKAISTGLIGATESSHFAHVADGTVLRDFYRDTVIHFQSAQDVFNNIQENWKELDITEGIDFLYHTLSVDIGADKPSMEKAHLEQIFTNLGQVRLLQSAHSIFSDVLQRWETVHEQKDCPMTSMDLLKNMLGLSKERYLGTIHVEAIVKGVRPPSIELEVLFLQDLLKAVRTTPILLYGSDAEFLNILDVFQTSLDDAIQREDEYLASLD